MAGFIADEHDEVMSEINMVPFIDVMLVLLTVQADGSYVLGEEKIADDQLGARLQAAARQQPQPDLHIRGDRDVRYERVAQAMAAAQQAGLGKIGFVTEPPRAP